MAPVRLQMYIMLPFVPAIGKDLADVVDSIYVHRVRTHHACDGLGCTTTEYLAFGAQ